MVHTIGTILSTKDTKDGTKENNDKRNPPTLQQDIILAMHQLMPYVPHSSLFQMGIFIVVTLFIFPHCILGWGKTTCLFNAEVAKLLGWERLHTYTLL